MDYKTFVLGAAVGVVLVFGSAGVYSSVQQQKGTVAVVKLSGSIQPSSQGFSPSGLTPAQVRDLTEQALKKNPDAVIYEINSGGGAVVASKEIMRVISDVEKPTVCRIRDIGASGAYLASLGCDRIVADSASLTGSIGVKASYLEFSGLLRKLGIEYVNLTAGRYKDAGSRYTNITREEKKLLKRKIDRVHEQFVGLVKDRRNLSKAETQEIRSGEAFLGEQAKQLGLVDRLGGRETAVETAENMTGEELKVVEVEKPSKFNFLSLLTSNLGFDLMNSQAPLSSRYR